MYRDLQEDAIILHPNKIESNEDMKLHCSERGSLRLVRWWQKRVHSMERYPGFSDHLHEIMQRIDLFVEQLRQTR